MQNAQVQQWVAQLRAQGYNDQQISAMLSQQQQQQQMNAMAGMASSNPTMQPTSDSGAPDPYSQPTPATSTDDNDSKMKLANWIVTVSGGQYHLEQLIQYPLHTLEDFAKQLQNHLQSQSNQSQGGGHAAASGGQASGTQSTPRSYDPHKATPTSGTPTTQSRPTAGTTATATSGAPRPTGGTTTGTTPDPLLTVKYLFTNYPQIGDWLRGTNSPYYSAVLTSAPHANAFIQQMIDSQPQFRQIIMTVQQNVAEQQQQQQQQHEQLAAGTSSGQAQPQAPPTPQQRIVQPPASSGSISTSTSSSSSIPPSANNSNNSNNNTTMNGDVAGGQAPRNSSSARSVSPPIVSSERSEEGKQHKKKKKKEKKRRKERKKSPKPYRRTSSHEDDFDYDDEEDYRPRKSKRKKSKKNKKRKRPVVSHSGEDTGSADAFSDGPYSDSSVSSALRDELETMLNQDDEEYQPSHDVDVGHGGIATRKSGRKSKKRHVTDLGGSGDDDGLYSQQGPRKKPRMMTKKHKPTIAPTEYTLVRKEENRFGVSLVLRKGRDYYHETLMNLGNAPFTMDDFGFELKKVYPMTSISNAMEDIEEQLIRMAGLNVVEEGTKEIPAKYTCDEYLTLVALEESSDVCMECSGRGFLVVCDGCPRSFHPGCVKETKESVEAQDKWYCPECKQTRESDGMDLDQDKYDHRVEEMAA